MALRTLKLTEDLARGPELLRAGSVVMIESAGGPALARQLVATGRAEWAGVPEPAAAAPLSPTRRMDRKTAPPRGGRRQ